MWRALKRGVIRAVQERERLERYAEAEIELAFDDEEGELLPGPADDERPDNHP